MLPMLGKRNMTTDIATAAKESDVTFLNKAMRNLGLHFLYTQDSKGRNVLHKLMKIKSKLYIMHDDFIEFIKVVLEILPALVCQTDKNGNTPVHVLVQNHLDNTIYVPVKTNNTTSGSLRETLRRNDVIYKSSSLREIGLLSELLSLCEKCITQMQKVAHDKGTHYIPPWLVPNASGNLPIHEAVIADNKKLVLQLLGYDATSASVVNKRKETLLHLLAGTHNLEVESFTKEDITKIVEANVEAALSLDKDRLTPLHRAFKAHNIGRALRLCILCPRAATISDRNGNTIWHMLVNVPSQSSDHCIELIKHEELRMVLEKKDNHGGNTPLHLVVKDKNFDMLERFFQPLIDNMQRSGRRHSSERDSRWLLDLLAIQNKAGETPADLIRELTALPPKIEEAILSDYRLVGIRSVWSISKSKLQEYMNSMNVIAALLVTITFTTAFTVPGGLIENIGTPILIRSIAFQIFMVSDILAMALSTMVIICLLWITASSDKCASVMIQDSAISLLLASLIATLLTFMMGVYATMLPVKPWIATTALVLCSLPSMLIRRTIVTKLLRPFSIARIYFSKSLMRGPHVAYWNRISSSMLRWLRKFCRSH